MKFTIPLPSGSYRVDLGFAETYGPTMAVGARVFDVKMENNVVFGNLDIYAEAGNAGNKALIKSTTVAVSDGTLAHRASPQGAESQALYHFYFPS